MATVFVETAMEALMVSQKLASVARCLVKGKIALKPCLQVALDRVVYVWWFVSGFTVVIRTCKVR